MSIARSIIISVLSMAIALNSPIRTEFIWLSCHARTPQLRSFRDFLLADFVIPKGKHKNTKIDLDVQPYVGLLADEIDNPRWTKYAITGCVQSGKSLIAFVAVIMYYLFEHGENVVVGVPTMKVGERKWMKEILPAIKASRFKAFLPTTGRGSKSGFAEDIHLTNGAIVCFMSGAGGDENRSSETARITDVTEVDKIDAAGEASREADPIRQMAARGKSYLESERRLILECTVSVEIGRIWTTYQSGTASRIACPCPYCEEYVTIERQHLRGWQEADSAKEAHRLAYYACPNCGDRLTEADRHKMNRSAKLVHRGQSIDRFGNITGDLPDTDTLGFRWNCFNNHVHEPGRGRRARMEPDPRQRRRFGGARTYPILLGLAAQAARLRQCPARCGTSPQTVRRPPLHERTDPGRCRLCDDGRRSGQAVFSLDALRVDGGISRHHFRLWDVRSALEGRQCRRRRKNSG